MLYEVITYLATVKTSDLILFTKQLRTMLAAGLSVLEMLNVP